MKNKKFKIHFIGIGGIGMSGIAELMHKIGYTVVSILSNFEVKKEVISTDKKDNNTFEKEDFGKIPRNALCPCGSGRKFKHCCGKI